MAHLIVRNGYQLFWYCIVAAAVIGGIGSDWNSDIMLRIANALVAFGAGLACSRALHSASGWRGLHHYLLSAIFALIALAFAYFVVDFTVTQYPYEAIGELFDALS